MEKAITIFLVWLGFTCMVSGALMLVFSIFADPKFLPVFVFSGMINAITLTIGLLTGTTEFKINNIEICNKQKKNLQ